MLITSIVDGRLIVSVLYNSDVDTRILLKNS